MIDKKRTKQKKKSEYYHQQHTVQLQDENENLVCEELGVCWMKEKEKLMLLATE
jgi:hypothetical protein